MLKICIIQIHLVHLYCQVKAIKIIKIWGGLTSILVIRPLARLGRGQVRFTPF
jgi:hypothetical protein